MKLAYPVATPDTTSQMLAYRGELAPMLDTLQEIGYTGLEPFVRNPAEMNVAAFSREVERRGFDIVAVGTGPIPAEDKLTFTDRNAEIRRAAIERAKAVIDFAATFGSQMNVGKLRGDIHPGLESESWQRMKEAFSEVCDYAARRAVPITLEPQNQFVINNLNSTQSALKFLTELGHGNLYVVLDVFHMHMEDKSPAASMIEARDVMLHVHFADSNRAAPGRGGINFTEAVRVLKALKYDRYITIEVHQFPDCRTAAAQSYRYVERLIREEMERGSGE